MTERLKALRRVLKVQEQLKRTADWRLAEAERAKAEIQAAEADLAAFLAQDGVVGPLAGVAIAQARRLAARGTAATEAAEAEATVMREATAREKLVAKAVKALAREEAAARERKDLERLIEGFAGRAMAGGPPGD